LARSGDNQAAQSHKDCARKARVTNDQTGRRDVVLADVCRIHIGHFGAQTATSGSPGCRTASATRERCVADRAL
jgi:hypothetical protein